ncbi:MAG: 6,7-dimethyl-8-ribityllumazine synthase [Legionellaceae bacterium]|nr:6,7-dimethyl-8-ribityllumazine synthase [Legionellaceae bacterium]
MKGKKILVAWSNYYDDLADKQLQSCLALLEKSDYDYHVETIQAGSYEIPAVINYYHNTNPFDGYIPLGLLLKGSTDHYEFIWEHIKACFIQFSLNGIMLGNGIISAPSMDVLVSRVDNGERVTEAFNAVDYLIKLSRK